MVRRSWLWCVILLLGGVVAGGRIFKGLVLPEDAPTLSAGPEARHVMAQGRSPESAAPDGGQQADGLEARARCTDGISGVLLSEDGEPLGRLLGLARGASHVSTASAPDGQFAFCALSPGTYELSFQGLGFSHVVPEQFGVGTHDLVIRVPRAICLTCRVIDELGRAVAGASIQATSAGESGRSHVGLTDEAGVGKLCGLTSGRHSVSAVHPLYLPAGEETVAVAVGSTPGLELTLREGLWTTGWVQQSDGSPVSGAWVKALRSPEEAAGFASANRAPFSPQSLSTWGVPAAQSDAHGRFRVGPLAAGDTYSLRVYAEEWMSVSASSDQHFSGAVSGIRLECEPLASLAGQVVDGTGQGIGAARIQLLESTPAVSDASAADRIWHASCDALGHFTVARLRVGGYRARASAEGYIAREWMLSATPEDAGPVLIVLEPAGSVSGVVLGADRQPLEGILVRLTPHPATEAKSLSARSGPLGAFRISELHPGLEYELEAWPRLHLPGLTYSERHRVVDGAHVDVCVVATGVISGRVVATDLDPASGVAVRLLARSATSVGWDQLGECHIPVASDGSFKLEGVTLSVEAIQMRGVKGQLSAVVPVNHLEAEGVVAVGEIWLEDG